MTTLEALETPTCEELRTFVRDRQVCWETNVHRDVGSNGVAAVGYDVILMARCRERACDPGGGCAQTIYDSLTQLAEAALPKDHGDDVRIGSFEPAFHLRRQADWQPEVQVIVEIRHDHGYFAAIDDDERTLVRRVEHALASWGVEHDTWPARRAQPGAA